MTDTFDEILAEWRDHRNFEGPVILPVIPDYAAMWANLKEVAVEADYPVLHELIKVIEKTHTPAELLHEDGKETEGIANE